ncbi:MAG: hypothetical protein RI952_1609 [Bacteroidota bacterium]|jgi:PKD repeat protein
MKYKFILTASLMLGMAIYSNAQTVVKCSTHEYTEEVSKQDPQFVINQAQLEKETQAFIKGLKPGANKSAVKIIPIVFHVFHNGGSENIPKERIIEQVEILNKDFRRLNADTASTNPIYKGIAADCQIEFRLAKIDPNGNCTDGIVRYQTDQTFNADNPIKALSAWPNNKYFNVWVVETITPSAGTPAGGVVLGRSQFPGGANSTDGILLKSTVCGNTTAYNNFGRTLSHEMGHSFNLRHIWGDATCGTDLVDDTPPHSAANSGCPVNKVSTCVSGNVIEMTENYMDYTDGSCQNMFSLGQNVRVQATINSTTNGRNNLWSAANLIATGTNDGYVAPLCVSKADFSRNQEVCTGITVQYKDGSYRGEPSAWEWTFEGGNPATSTLQNPTVVYTKGGRYDVKLKVTNTAGSDSISKAGFLKVFETVSTVGAPFGIDMENAQNVDSIIYNKPNNTKNWERVTNTGFNSSSALAMKFYGISDGQINSFLLPSLNLKGTTNPVMKFKVAYAMRTALSTDELNVGASRNCGVTFSNLYTKSGSSLATAPTVTSQFIPTTSAQWRQDSISLSAYTNEDNAIFRFKATNGAPGNNMYLDDIVISVTTGIEHLILNNLNFSIAPNPFANETKLSFFLVQPAYVTIDITDVLGRKLKTIAHEQMNAAAHQITINNNQAELKNGIYFIRMNIGGIQKVERLIVNQ